MDASSSCVHINVYTGTCNDNLIVKVIVIALCLQYVLKGYPRTFLELLTGTPLI